MVQQPSAPGQASTPDRILRAVRVGLIELDPAALTIQQVCSRAGVTPPTIYYHFGSKDGLVAAAVDSMATAWIGQLESLIDRRGTLDQTLDQAVFAWHLMITAPERPIAVFVWASMWSDESRVALLRARSHAQATIRDAIVGHLGPIPDSDDLAGLLLDGILGAAVDYQLDSDEDQLRRRLTTLVSVIRLRAAATPDAASPASHPTA
jgi:AcrR family transcriptional regulator